MNFPVKAKVFPSDLQYYAKIYSVYNEIEAQMDIDTVRKVAVS